MRVNVIFILVVVLISADNFNTGSGQLGNGHFEESEELNKTVTSQYDYNWEQDLAVTQVGKSTITVQYHSDETGRTSLEYDDQVKRNAERKKDEEMAFWILFFISFQTHHRFQSTGHSTVRRDCVHRMVFDPQSESFGFNVLYSPPISSLFMLGLKIVWGIRQALLMLCNDIEKNPGPVNIEQLYDAARRGDLTTVQMMCDSADKNELKELLVTSVPGEMDGRTVLHAVAEQGHVKVLEYLLQLLPDLNLDCCDEDRETPLHLAAGNGNTQCVQYLVECGAAVDCRDNAGGTPLYCAVLGRQLPTVRVLVERGADPDIRTGCGDTALECAVEEGHTEIISYLTNLNKMVPDEAGTSGKKEEIPGPANVNKEAEVRGQLEKKDNWFTKLFKIKPRTSKDADKGPARHEQSDKTKSGPPVALEGKPSDEEGMTKELEDETTDKESSRIGKSTTASEETTITKGPRKGQSEQEVKLDTSNIELGVFSTTKKRSSIDLNLPGNYLVKEVIGQGGFGRVYLCIDKDTGRNYAVKNCFYGTQSSKFTKILRSFQREIMILKELKHQNIVAYHSHYDEGGHFNIVMEYVSGGSMRKYITENGPLSMTYTIKCLGDILHGLSYLHENDTIHRDLKSANVLRTNEGNIKLADFGASKCLDALQSIAHTFIGTPYWMSPEVIDEEDAGYSKKIDIWGVGVVAFEFLIGRAPFEGLKRRAAENKILNNETKTICEEQLVSPIADHRLRDFTLSCVQFNPKDRPTAEEALKDPVFSGVV